MFKRVPSARTKADKRYAADCSNVQPHYWQYYCYQQYFSLSVSTVQIVGRPPAIFVNYFLEKIPAQLSTQRKTK